MALIPKFSILGETLNNFIKRSEPGSRTADHPVPGLKRQQGLPPGGMPHQLIIKVITMEQNKPVQKVIIEIRGGIIQFIHSTVVLEYVVIDYDPDFGIEVLPATRVDDVIPLLSELFTGNIKEKLKAEGF